jgi:hypothetical protein
MLAKVRARFFVVPLELADTNRRHGTPYHAPRALRRGPRNRG